MEILDTISRFVHIGTAIVLVGGSVFTLMVLMPAAKKLPDEPHAQLAEAQQQHAAYPAPPLQTRSKSIIDQSIIDQSRSHDVA